LGRIYEYAGIRPVVDDTAFVHPEAVIIGDVIIGPGSMWHPSSRSAATWAG
jgi:phenylacetic acid degradation protein